MAFLTGTGPLTKEVLNNIKANKKEELKELTNSVYPERTKLPVDFLICPLCSLKLGQTRYVKRHMEKLDCRFEAIKQDNTDSEEENENKRERENQDRPLLL